MFSNMFFDIYPAEHGFQRTVLLSHYHRDHIPIPQRDEFDKIFTPDVVTDTILRGLFIRYGIHGIEIIHSLEGVEYFETEHEMVSPTNVGPVHRGSTKTYGYYIRRKRMLLIPETNEFQDERISTYTVKTLVLTSQPKLHFYHMIKGKIIFGHLLPIQKIEALQGIEKIVILNKIIRSKREINIYIAEQRLSIEIRPPQLLSLEEALKRKRDKKLVPF